MISSITRIVEGVMMEDWVCGLMEAKMMMRRIRMRLEVAFKTRGEIIPIISMIKIIEIREEEERIWKMRFLWKMFSLWRRRA